MNHPALVPEALNNLLKGGELADKHWFFLLIFLGFFIDLVLMHFLHQQGFLFSAVHSVGFITALGVISSVFWFYLSSHQRTAKSIKQSLYQWIIIILLLLFLRGGILSSAVDVAGFSPGLGFLICAIITWISFYLIIIFYDLSDQSVPDQAKKNQRYFLIGIVIYSIALRFFYLGTPELFYEEAYYWNYAKHLDLSYLDHPPLVAWLIGLSSAGLGDHEFAVRFSAWICWLITAGFIHRLTSIVHREQDALRSVALVAVLPIFFVTGWMMTPDAPLMACWAALVYFLYQALILQNRNAWFLAGIALGLGMLAKYTIILVALAALLWVITDSRARKWLWRPEPYWATLIAIILFSPVIFWNAQQDWASFLYQSQNRIAERAEFSLDYFFLSIILILTPSGFFSVILIYWFRKNLPPSQAIVAPEPTETAEANSESAQYGKRLLLILTIFPLSVLALTSVFRETKFHWTGPIWLAILPYMGLLIVPNVVMGAPRLWRWVQRSWPPTLLICLLSYGVFLHYVTLGWPGVPYPSGLFLLGWSDFGREIQALADQFQAKSGESVLVVGMDRNRIASGLAFYQNKALQSSATESDPAWQRTSSWHLFDRKGLMYEYWFPQREQENKNLLLVSKNPLDLSGDAILARIQSAEEIKPITLWKNQRPAGQYYYRLVQGYRSTVQTAPPFAKGQPD